MAFGNFGPGRGSRPKGPITAAQLAHMWISTFSVGNSASGSAASETTPECPFIPQVGELCKDWNVSTSLVCYAAHCTNSGQKLLRLSNTRCQEHDSNMGVYPCTCPPPFKLHKWPTARQDRKARERWKKAFSRFELADETGLELLEPKKGHRVCSAHFVDGAPTTSNPDPTLNLGHHKKVKKAQVTPPPDFHGYCKNQNTAQSSDNNVYVAMSMDDDIERPPIHAALFPYKVIVSLSFLISILLSLWRKSKATVRELVKENSSLRKENYDLKMKLRQVGRLK